MKRDYDLVNKVLDSVFLTLGFMFLNQNDLTDLESEKGTHALRIKTIHSLYSSFKGLELALS